MKDPMRPILLATLIMITILLFMNYAVGKEKTKSEWLNENPCMIKVVITNTEINGITTTTARPNHPFKTPGMLCLSENGVWEKQ